MRLRLLNNVSCNILELLTDLKRFIDGQALLKSSVLTHEPGATPSFLTIMGNSVIWRNGRGTHCVFGATSAAATSYLAGEHRSFDPAAPTELVENIFNTSSTSILTATAAGNMTLDFYYTDDVTALAVVGGALSNTYNTIAWFSKPASVSLTSLGRTLMYQGTAPGASSLAQTKSFDCGPGANTPLLQLVPGLVLPISHAAGLFDGSTLVKRPVPLFSTFAHDLSDLNRRALMLYGPCGYSDVATVNGRVYRGFGAASWSGGLFLEAGV